MAFARDVSKRVIFMANGVIVEDRPPKELFENPKDPLTKDFLSRFRNAWQLEAGMHMLQKGFRGRRLRSYVSDSYIEFKNAENH